jgi:hypothetical protein
VGLARRIAANASSGVQGVKRFLAAARHQSVEQGLEEMARWNSEHIDRDEVVEALGAFLQERPQS